jgi:drug/metabolite transporter (DMT)-like permease
MSRGEKNYGSTDMESLLDSLSSEDQQPQFSRRNPSAPGVPPVKAHSAQSLFSIPTGPRKTGRHHRHKSSLSQIFESMSGGLGLITEEMKLEVKNVKGVFIRELNDADQGRTYFLDMTMTRSLSVLPDELQDFVDEALGKELPREAPPEASALGRYASLLGAVLAVSSNGPALAFLHGVEPPMKLFWRMTTTALVLSTFAFRVICKDGFPVLSFGQWVTFTAAAVCFFLQTLLFYFALDYTSVDNAVIGANSQALLLILGKFFAGEKVLLLEGLGVFLTFGGCLLCAGRGEVKGSKGADDDSTVAIFGDMLALASGAAGVGYLTFAKAVRPHLATTVFMFLMMVCGAILVLAYMLLVEMPVTFNNDPYTGLFGWMNLEGYHIYVLMHIALICNVVGTMGYVRAMQYFENIVIAVATLLEPIAATLIAFALGVGQLPSTMGWIGNGLVVIGTLAVVYASIDKPMDH